MTPLAHRIVKELTLPLRDRTFDDRIGLLKRMNDIHCFEISAVEDAVSDLAHEMSDDINKIGRLAFLPAPRTWIEALGWGMSGNCGRTAVLLEQQDGDTHCKMFCASGSEYFGSAFVLELPLAGDRDIGRKVRSERAGDYDLRAGDPLIFHRVYAALALINTPRIVGRITRLPHRGLEKALIAKRQSVGHWPLHAWHEIKLSITPPDAAPGEIEEGHLTGKRALHFVRQHLRIRQGRLELVSAHWRGDAQLGIKRARYAVVH